MDNRKNRWPLIFGVFLAAWSALTLLDAFVIPRDIVTVAESPAAQTAPPEKTDAPEAVRQEVTERAASESAPEADSYQDENISITITTFETHGTTVYAADVTLRDASYLKTGLAGDAFGRNLSEKTSVMAEANGAIFAVNGDYYGFRDSGFVLRNGYLYRTTAQPGTNHEDLVIWADGRLEIVNEAESDAEALQEAGATQIFCFGPGLVRDGEITVAEDYEVVQAMSSNPRTAIGEIGPLHYVFVVSDGRSSESAGLSLYELAEVLRDLGCVTAYNLDGGGSSTMWFQGQIINKPTSGRRIGERSVSDIVYIGE